VVSRERGSESWRFSHGAFREAALTLAEQGGQAARLHLAAAAILEGGSGVDTVGRRGRHLLEGGDAEGAIAPLARGAGLLIGHARRAEAAGLLRDWERAMTRAAVPPSDPRWGTGWIHRVTVEYSSNNHEVAQEWATKTAEHGREHGWPYLGRALHLMAVYEREEGHPQRAEALFREAISVLEPRGLESKSLCHLAALVEVQDRAEAERLFRRAVESADRLGQDSYRITVANLLGFAHLRWEQFELGEQTMRRAIRMAEEAQRFSPFSVQFVALAGCLRGQGRLEEAEVWYRRVPETDLRMLPLSLTGLGQVELARGDFSGAKAYFERAVELALATGRRQQAASVHGRLLVIRAAEGDWQAFDAGVRAAAKMKQANPEVERLVLDAAGRATLAGEHSRAHDARELAERIRKLNR